MLSAFLESASLLATMLEGRGGWGGRRRCCCSVAGFAAAAAAYPVVMASSMDAFRIFRRGKGSGDYKSRIAVALREIEGQRKELDMLKARLAERRQQLFEMTVRSFQDKNKSKAAVY